MEDNSFLSYLRKSKEENTIVSVYTNANEPDRFSAGVIEVISIEHFIMKHVTLEGLYDGYIIRRFDDIFRIDFNGQYEQRLSLLYRLQNQHHPNFLKNEVDEDTNLFLAALLAAQESLIVTRVSIDETGDQDDIVGFVQGINDSGIIVSEISFEGLADGESVFMIDDIVKMHCDSVEERVLGLLYKVRSEEVE